MEKRGTKVEGVGYRVHVFTKIKDNGTATPKVRGKKLSEGTDWLDAIGNAPQGWQSAGWVGFQFEPDDETPARVRVSLFTGVTK